jgi:flotillin
MDMTTQSLQMLATALLVGGGLVGLALLGASLVKRFLHICEPDELLIFSGRSHRTVGGDDVGFRIVRAGRAFVIPVIERVDRMDVSLISVPMTIRGAYSEGGIPLNLHAIANVKISDDDAVVGNAIERFLGRSTKEIARVAKETLEGHLRGVIATMTPEEVNEDRLKFAERLLDEAGEDLRKLGLQLDTLKIQHVSDERQYLDSIGRKRIAEIVRTAEVAESDAQRAAAEAEAAAHARSGIAEKKAETAVQKRLNELRTAQAKLDARARSEEERGEAAARQARAVAELELQEIRSELERLRLQAEVEIPAEIERQARELIATGRAASIEENGRAIAAAFAAVAQAYKELGDGAMDMVVSQHLEGMVAKASEVAMGIRPEEVALLDGGDGGAVAGYAAAYPATVRRILDELGTTLGVDVTGVLNAETKVPAYEPTPAPSPVPEAA